MSSVPSRVRADARSGSWGSSSHSWSPSEASGSTPNTAYRHLRTDRRHTRIHRCQHTDSGHVHRSNNRPPIEKEERDPPSRRFVRQANRYSRATQRRGTSRRFESRRQHLHPAKDAHRTQHRADRFSCGSQIQPGTWREPEPDDEDWDKELAGLTGDQATRRERLLRLLLRLGRYTFSDPFSVTVDPFTLPPDPGEAGKQTLEGIDSDNDGVRDDIQRYIALTHLDSPRTQKALLQSAAAEQAQLLAPDDAVGATSLPVIDSIDCLAYVVGVDALHKESADLRARILNTKSRSLKYESIQQSLSGSFFAGTARSQRQLKCTFDPDRSKE